MCLFQGWRVGGKKVLQRLFITIIGSLLQKLVIMSLLPGIGSINASSDTMVYSLVSHIFYVHYFPSHRKPMNLRFLTGFRTDEQTPLTEKKIYFHN